MARKVLIIGATGTIGTHITAAIADAVKSFERVAIFTSPATAESKKGVIESLKSKGVEVIVGDIEDDEQLKKVFSDFDTVVSALGRGALHLQTRLVDLYASLPKFEGGKPRRFYPSEYGTDIRYDPVTSPHEKPHQNKLKTRAHIEALAKEGKIEFTYVVTGPFLDTFLYVRGAGQAGYDRQNTTFHVVGSEDPFKQSRISGTTYKDTGKYVLSSLLTPEASANATLRVSSIDAKPSEIISALESIENKKIKTTYITPEEFRKAEEKAWSEEAPNATVYTLTRIWYEGGSDFTKKPRALYLRNGEEVEDNKLEEQLFKDVPKLDTKSVLQTLL